MRMKEGEWQNKERKRRKTRRGERKKRWEGE